MNIIEATKDRNLFRPYLQGTGKNLSSWQNWLICLRVIYGMKVQKPENLELIRQCTGRDPAKLDPNGYNTVLLLCGRRGGKSKISGLIGAYEAMFSGKEKLLSPGEIPMLTITSPTKDQSTIIKSYMRAALAAPMLNAEVGLDVRQGFPLSNGVVVRILTGDFKSVRGFTQIAVVVDEVCWFGKTEDSSAKSDTELLRSIRPALLTTKGRLICVSTKYSPSGWAYSQWKRCFGNDTSQTLVWDATSKGMNPLLSQEDIDTAIAEDPEAGAAEFLNQWREDVAIFLPREVVEAVVVKNRLQLMPRQGTNYFAFVDMSGGRRDSACLGIAHKDERKVIMDYLREWKAPFSPFVVTGEMAAELNRYHLKMVVGDRYSAEFTVQAFRNHHINYKNAELNKSQLYLDLLPRICSREIELLDNERSVSQLSSLERRCRSGGNDIVEHSSGAYDDLANTIAGVSKLCGKPRMICGGWDLNANSKGQSKSDIELSRKIMQKALIQQTHERM